MELPVKEILAQGGLAIALAISLFFNVTLVKWIRELYGTHADRLDKAAKDARDQQADRDRTYTGEQTKVADALRALQVTVTNLGQQLLSMAMGRSGMSGRMPAVRDEPPREGR